MPRTRDPRGLLWGLLGLVVAIELLYSSRWMSPRLPRPAPGAETAAAQPASLRSLLEASRLEALRRTQPPSPVRVWFAPYTTFPETGMLESQARTGVYDTLLALPVSGIASNYGAFKLSPADTLFSLGSAYGLASELRLARRLGYGAYALDLGAVTDPDGAALLCRRSPGCRISDDGYALFPIGPGSSGSPERGLALLQRRIPLLPQKSAGVTWGPLVLPLLQWGAFELRPSADGDPALVVQANARSSMEIYRYPLQRYPLSVQPWLKLSGGDVQVSLADDVISAELCIGPVGAPCRNLSLGPGRRRQAIADQLVPGRLSRIEILSLLRQPGGQGLFRLELRAPAAAQALLSSS